MALANTTTYYGSVTKTFHWLTALLILTLIPLGWYAAELPFESDAELARKAWLFSLHKTLGVAAFFVAIARIFWALTQSKPALLNSENRLESFAAEAVHWALYGGLVIVPLSGWISHAAAAGFAPIWWPLGQGLPLIPKSTQVEHIAGAIHWVSGRVLIASIILHIAGALKHHVIDKDATLRRMLPHTPVLAPRTSLPHKTIPALIALFLWVTALTFGTVMGGAVSDRVTNGTAPEIGLVAAASDWTVQEGEISLTVVQFGSEVTGSFADWTSAITFDENNPGLSLGKVKTTIAISSLTLGSVTQQAMGADFFDATNYPTAVFEADIQRGNDGYDAVGTLTIRNKTVPLTLPFGMSIREGIAEMRGDLTLDRRDFNIGDNMKDASSLAFNVRVKITLTARHRSSE